MFCTRCGNQLKEGQKFCNQCGKPVPVKNITTPVTEISLAAQIQETVINTVIQEPAVQPAETQAETRQEEKFVIHQLLIKYGYTDDEGNALNPETDQENLPSVQETPVQEVAEPETAKQVQENTDMIPEETITSEPEQQFTVEEETEVAIDDYQEEISQVPETYMAKYTSETSKAVSEETIPETVAEEEPVIEAQYQYAQQTITADHIWEETVVQPVSELVENTVIQADDKTIVSEEIQTAAKQKKSGFNRLRSFILVLLSGAVIALWLFGGFTVSIFEAASSSFADVFVAAGNFTKLVNIEAADLSKYLNYGFMGFFALVIFLNFLETLIGKRVIFSKFLAVLGGLAGFGIVVFVYVMMIINVNDFTDVFILTPLGWAFVACCILLIMYTLFSRKKKTKES